MSSANRAELARTCIYTSGRNSCAGYVSILFHFRSGSQIPESPVWLIAKGKTEKAKEALCWLRGWTDLEAVDTEHQEYILYNQVSGNDARKEKADDGQTLLSKLKEFKDPSVYRPFNFVIIFFFACDLVGLWPCRPYFGKIMTAVNIEADVQSLLLVGNQHYGYLLYAF